MKIYCLKGKPLVCPSSTQLEVPLSGVPVHIALSHVQKGWKNQFSQPTCIALSKLCVKNTHTISERKISRRPGKLKKFNISMHGHCEWSSTWHCSPLGPHISRHYLVCTGLLLYTWIDVLKQLDLVLSKRGWTNHRSTMPPLTYYVQNLDIWGASITDKEISSDPITCTTFD